MKEKKFLINEKIKSEKIRLIDKNGNQRGIMEREKALEEAKKEGLDLVEVGYDNEISVCKILDYGKYKYEQNKKIKEGKKRQRIMQIKEIKLKPAIDDHDLQFKTRKAREFLEDGQKIKVVLTFRGREILHPDIGMNVITKFADILKDISVIEKRPSLEDQRITMVICPSKEVLKKRASL